MKTERIAFNMYNNQIKHVQEVKHFDLTARAWDLIKIFPKNFKNMLMFIIYIINPFNVGLIERLFTLHNFHECGSFLLC